jgi:hypothetical protein
MADLYQPNKAAPGASGADWFSYTWFTTRMLLKAGWLHKGSSDATNKVTSSMSLSSSDPSNCKWGAPAAIVGQSGSVASIGAKTGSDFAFFGLTGLVAPTKLNQGGSEGNTLTITGAANIANNTEWQITNVLSSTSCLARPIADRPGSATDANSTAISWTEKSYLTTTYSAMASGAWICLQGPSTLKIPFTVAPVGVFIRGENVVQTTTGAEGEVLGVTYEPSTGVGMLVIAPRLTGTGTGRKGWQQDGTATYVITGAKSSATVNPNGTISEFVREVVWQRGANLFDGTIYYQCMDAGIEGSTRFSYLSAVAAGCTATIAPGEGGTNNGFPTTGTYIVLGTAGSVGHCTAAWNRTAYSTANLLSKGQYFVANCIDKQNVSQDGSWFVAQGQPTTSAASAGYQPFLMRLDQGEEGDLEPYAFFAATGTNFVATRTYNATRTGQTPTFGDNLNAAVFMQGSNLATPEVVSTFRRRGYATGDAYVDGGVFYLWMYWSNQLQGLINTNTVSTQERMSHSLQTTAPIVMDFPTIAAPWPAGAKVRKGVPRWIGTCSGNTGFDTFGNKTWCQVGSTQDTNVYNQAFLMPWDGSTTPVQ